MGYITVKSYLVYAIKDSYLKHTYPPSSLFTLCKELMLLNCSVWRRLLRVPWTARRSSQSVPKEINPKEVLEGLMLKLQYFSHLVWRASSWKKPWCWEWLRARGERGDRGWLGGITDSMDMNLSKLQKIVKNRETWCAAVHWVTKSRTWQRLNNNKPSLLNCTISCDLTSSL